MVAPDPSPPASRGASGAPPAASFVARDHAPAALDLAVLGALFGAAFLAFTWAIPITEPDEGRYAEIPREMLERGDFVTPRLNGVKYFEKPPLHYWLCAASLAAGGETEVAVRLPGALAALAGLLWTYAVGRKAFGRRAGLAAATVLGTSVGYAALARIAIIDPLLAACMALCLGSVLIAVRPGERRAGAYWHLAWAGAALAVLAKGLVGIVLPAGIVALFALAARRPPLAGLTRIPAWLRPPVAVAASWRRILSEARPATGLPLFLAIAAPWFVVVSVRNPEFPDFFFVNEHFRRFLTTAHGHDEPFWFFGPMLLALFLPWSFFLPGLAVSGWRRRREAGAEERLFLLAWVAGVFGFFSVSGSKLPPYILPLFPALALLAGEAFAAGTGGGRRPGAALPALAGAACAAGGLACPVIFGLAPNIPAAPGTGWILAAVLVPAGAAALLLARRDLVRCLAALAAGWLAIGVLAGPLVVGTYADRKSTRELARLVRERASGSDVVANYIYDQAFNFYAGRRVVVVGRKGELEFGSDREGPADAAAWFPDFDAFGRLWDSDRRVFILIDDWPEKPGRRRPELEEISARARTPIRIVAKQRGKVIAVNRE